MIVRHEKMRPCLEAMIKSRAIGVIVACILIAGCGQATEGYITAKRHEPISHHVVIVPIKVGETMTPMPMTQVVPEQWVLTIEGTDTEVSEAVYESVSIGDWYTEKGAR